MEKCDCGTGKTYTNCCGPIHEDPSKAQTAEALMRARYCAFCRNKPGFLWDTLHPNLRREADLPAIQATIDSTTWLRLKILATQKGKPGEKKGVVVFEARFKTGEQIGTQKERSEFEYLDRWYYTGGQAQWK